MEQEFKMGTRKATTRRTTTKKAAKKMDTCPSCGRPKSGKAQIMEEDLSDERFAMINEVMQHMDNVRLG
jgi:hypothetical protein